MPNPARLVAGHIQKPPQGQCPGCRSAAAETGSALYTDALKSYEGLAGEYVHQVVDHAVEFVRENVHTNGTENFWSLFKRALKGTYVSVEPFHLDAYVKEQTFRFNERKSNDSGRFRAILGAVTGKRLTYKELKGYGEATA